MMTLDDLRREVAELDHVDGTTPVYILFDSGFGRSALGGVSIGQLPGRWTKDTDPEYVLIDTED